MTQATDPDTPTASSTSSGATVEQERPDAPKVAEFFAGIGLARMGLEKAGFEVVWANDIDAAKRDTYVGHFGPNSSDHYRLDDICNVAESPTAAGFPAGVDLAWASFPCTDLSLAGDRKGLAGAESGLFWKFIEVLEKLPKRPAVVALENVNGFATSRGGSDLREAAKSLSDAGYWVDVVTLDARSWVPQSRPRLFIVGSLSRVEDVAERNRTLRPRWLDHVFEDREINTHQADIPSPPPLLTGGWTSIVEDIPLTDELWWDAPRTDKFIAQLSDFQLKRVDKLSSSESVVYRTAYRRTREGKPAWEIREDDIAGCLRAARGGSSKQAVVRMAQGQPLRVRWMTRLEYARLMGASTYTLPDRHSHAVMGFGDAVCVDAVEWLTANYLGPLLAGKLSRKEVNSDIPHQVIPVGDAGAQAGSAIATE